jgi:hypothetical protein
MLHNLLLLQLISNLTLSLLYNDPVVQLGGSVLLITKPLGRTITQTGGHQLPTTIAWVRGWSGTGTGFLFIPWFPLPILIPPTADRTVK